MIEPPEPHDQPGRMHAAARRLAAFTRGLCADDCSVPALPLADLDRAGLLADADLVEALAGPGFAAEAPPGEPALGLEAMLELALPDLSDWLGEGTVLGLDLETCGKPKPEEAWPVQVAFVTLIVLDGAPDRPRGEPGGLVRRASRLIRPGPSRQPASICDSSRAVHGISNEDVAGAPFLEQVADALAQTLERARWVVGFNASGFDLPVLALASQRAAAGASCAAGRDALLRLEAAARGALRRCLDPSAMLRDRERRTLAAVLARAGVDLGERAHEAGADTLGALLALWRELPRWRSPEDAAACVEGANFLDVKRQLEVVGDDALELHRQGLPPPSDAVFMRFGKHRDRSLSAVARDDGGYLDWCLGQNFERAARDAMRRAIAAEQLRAAAEREGRVSRLPDPRSLGPDSRGLGPDDLKPPGAA